MTRDHKKLVDAVKKSPEGQNILNEVALQKATLQLGNQRFLILIIIAAVLILIFHPY